MMECGLSFFITRTIYCRAGLCKIFKRQVRHFF